MNIDFPLLLVLLCFAGIFIWLFDALVLAGPRRQRIQAVKTQQTMSSEGRERALAAAAREPWLVETAKSLLPVLLVVLILRSFLVEPFKIPSSSMEPTLLVGDYILVNKFTYGLRLPVLGTKVVPLNEPARGDVMVFFKPGTKVYYIKRVIGLPGDRVAYDSQKRLTINGEAVPHALIAQLPTEILWQESIGEQSHQIRQYPVVMAEPFSLVVEPGHYFMMGDNRDNSLDSRAWGLVPEKDIVGRAFAVWMHWPHWGTLPSFDRLGAIH